MQICADGRRIERPLLREVSAREGRGRLCHSTKIWVHLGPFLIDFGLKIGPKSLLFNYRFWRSGDFDDRVPPPPGFDPIRPKVTQFDPVLRASADGRNSDRGDDALSRRSLSPPPPPVIPISKRLTRFIPTDPQLAVLQTNAFNPIIPIRYPFARGAFGFGLANCQLLATNCFFFNDLLSFTP
jgi:hypothetical protein